MILLKTLIKEVRFDYGCIMAQLPPEVATPIISFGKKIISDNMLYFDKNEPDDYGREKEMHITIKFGLTQTYTEQQIMTMLRGTKAFDVTLSAIDVFSNSNFDVIKINADGPELHRLRKVFDTLPNTDAYPVYHPHATIAYVKSGLGSPFKGKTMGTTPHAKISLIKYSDRGDPHFFKLC